VEQFGKRSSKIKAKPNVHLYDDLFSFEITLHVNCFTKLFLILFILNFIFILNHFQNCDIHSQPLNIIINLQTKPHNSPNHLPNHQPNLPSNLKPHPAHSTLSSFAIKRTPSKFFMWILISHSIWRSEDSAASSPYLVIHLSAKAKKCKFTASQHNLLFISRRYNISRCVERGENFNFILNFKMRHPDGFQL
jgi:hypothetical protein